MTLQFLCKLCRLADAYKQNSCCKGVQSTGMSDLEVLLSEMTDCGELDLSDHVRRSPSVWFVNRDDDPFRIVGDVS